MSYAQAQAAFMRGGQAIAGLGGVYAQAVAAGTAVAIGPDGKLVVRRMPRRPGIRPVAIEPEPVTRPVAAGPLEGVRRVLDTLAPPGFDGTVADVVAGLSSGFAVTQEGPLAPWSMFTDPRLAGTLDADAWTYWGFARRGAGATDRDTTPFARALNVPDAVRDPANLGRLQTIAAAPMEISTAPFVVAGDHLSLWLRNITTGFFEVPTAPAPPASTSASTSQPLIDPDSKAFQDAQSCFERATWRMEWYGPVICLDRPCADTIEGLLFSPLSKNIGEAIKAFLAKGTLGAAISAVGGWIALGIMVSMAYWGMMIRFNKAANGVCLHIPGPWTFGLMGPGWAVGRR